MSRARRDYPAWPARPARTEHASGVIYRHFDIDQNGRCDYIQRVCDGFIDELRFRTHGGGAVIIPRPHADPTAHPLVLLLLDGVALERVERLYARGHFRLFRPPARVISTFPTLTDPAYDVFFGTGPTPGYEACYMDRNRGRLTNGLGVYLSGANERWVQCADCRLNFVEDGLMYLFPQGVFTSELKRARRALDRVLAAGERFPVIYILSTDALGHMFPADEIERQLRRVDAWVERLVYDLRGRVEIVMMADHGISALPVERGHLKPFDLPQVLRDAGVRVVPQPRQPDDVVVPMFGLLDVARVYVRDEAAKSHVAEVLAHRAEIELVAMRVGPTVEVRRGAARGVIERRDDNGTPVYRYRPLVGDPLRLSGTGTAAPTSNGAYVTADTWLAASATDVFPGAVPRLWDGLFEVCRDCPDLVASVADEWFVGSGVFSSLVRQHGTHGGLHRRVSETFVMSTSGTLVGPLWLTGVRQFLAGRFGWQPARRERAGGLFR